jgi:hypothetical protein
MYTPDLNKSSVGIVGVVFIGSLVQALNKTIAPKATFNSNFFVIIFLFFV